MGATTEYLLGLDVVGQQRNGAWDYFTYDGLGSVRQINSGSGASKILLGQDYTPFGQIMNPVGTVTTRLGFTGEYTDPSGLLYLRARYANLSTATFLSLDPVMGVDGGQSIHWNGYAYAGMNPVNYVDPSGRFFNPIAGLIGGAIHPSGRRSAWA